MKKVRTKIKQEAKTRSILQQEVDSVCPLCSSTDVGHFQIHHIDENPSNNELANLLLVCPTCHSKITKGDISQTEVQTVKLNLPNGIKVEIAAITIDKKNCCWDTYDNIPNAFIKRNNGKPSYPILNFSLINHSSRTVLMKEVVLKVKHLFDGFAGLSGPKPELLKPIATFKIKLPDADDTDTTFFELTNEISVPPSQAFKFQIQLYRNWNNKDYPVVGRMILYFTFKFNNNASYTAPKVFLNCKSENEGLRIQVLS
ncbi:MAG: HNH endonuclease [Chitinophagales bacterium]|nr:HNH endonuclease [Chitinophagales bacterium]